MTPTTPKQSAIIEILLHWDHFRNYTEKALDVQNELKAHLKDRAARIYILSDVK